MSITHNLPTHTWEQLESALLCLEAATAAARQIVRGHVKAEPVYLVSIRHTVETALAHLERARHEIESEVKS